MKVSVFAACNEYNNPYMIKADTYEALLNRAKLGGMDAIEYVMEDPDKFDADAFRRAMEDTHMEVSLIQPGYLVSHEKLSLINVDKEIEARAMERYKKLIKNAADIGVGANLGVMQGRALPLTPISVSENLLIDKYKELADYCEKVNGFFCFETSDRYVTDYCFGTDAVIRIIEKVNSDRLRMTMDVEHVYVEDSDMIEAVIKSRKYLQNVHFMDADHTPCGFAKGYIDFKKIIEALKLIDYKGFLVTNLVRAETDKEKAKDEGMKVTSKYIRGLINA